jgi:hypothetical protein
MGTQENSSADMNPVLVVSPGGMACTYVLRSLRELGVQTNDPFDRDRLKHCGNPEDRRYSICKGWKRIYVWNDPLLAICSFARRGWLVQQRRKLLGREAGALESLELLWRETSAQRQDVYGIERHLARWHSFEEGTMFWLDFRNLDRCRERLAEFLGITSTQIHSMRLHERRASKAELAPPGIREIYSALDARGRKICGNLD